MIHMGLDERLDPRARAGDLASELEAELRRLNVWRAEPLPPEAMQFTRPFGGDTMPFEHWIQFVLIPRLREVATGTSRIPPSSNLIGYAVREFDGRELEMRQLIGLLGEIDALSPRPMYGPGASMGAMTILLAAISGWAVFSIFGAYAIASWLAERQPQRVLVFANFAETTRGPLAGLVFQTWGHRDRKTEIFRGENASLTITPRREPSRPGKLQLSLEIDLTADPPQFKGPDAPPGLEWSAVGFSRWAEGKDGENAAADPQCHAVFKLLSELKQGISESALRDQLQRIEHLLGGRSGADIRHYPASITTSAFVGSFCALFLPPTVAWMVVQYRRNLRRLRGR